MDGAVDAMRARVEASLARQGLLRELGVELVETGPGRVVLCMDYSPRVTQQHGYFHGAAVAAVADVAGGYAAMTLAPEGFEVLTVEYKISLHAPADGERLTATARVLRPGRLSTCLVDVSVQHGGEERPGATVLQTVAPGAGTVGQPGLGHMGGVSAGYGAAGHKLGLPSHNGTSVTSGCGKQRRRRSGYAERGRRR